MSIFDAASKDYWTKTTLGEFTSQKRKTIDPSKSPHVNFELYSIPAHHSGKPENVLGSTIGSSKQLVEPGEVLLSKINPRINRVWVVGSSGLHPQIASTEWIVFRPDTKVSSQFLYYFLQIDSLRDFLSANASGVGGSLMRVKASTLASFPFSYPGITSQQLLTNHLDRQTTRLTQGVRDLYAVKQKLALYRASVLKAACEGRLVPTEAELARQEGRDFETGEQLLNRILAIKKVGELRRQMLPTDGAHLVPPENIPEGWAWTSLGQSCSVYVGATPSRSDSAYWSGSVPWVTSGEVNFCKILSTREQITNLGLQNTSTQVHPVGTVLMGMIGKGKTRGQVAILGIAAAHNQNTAAIRPAFGMIDSKFLYYYLYGRYQVTRAGSSGNNQPALNKARVNSIPFPLPPLAEQLRIVAEVDRRLSIIDQLEATVAANLQRATRIRQSILQKAFSLPSEASSTIEPAQPTLEFSH